MNNSHQYFFSVTKLDALLEEFRYKRNGASEKTIFRGFVFTPGEDNNKDTCCFAFPLYSDNPIDGAIEEMAVILQNTSRNPGCPYPPPCL